MRTVTGSSGGLASSAFWSRWPTACSSAAASAIAQHDCRRRQRDVVARALRRRSAATRIGAQRLRLELRWRAGRHAARAAPAGRSSCRPSSCSVATMSARNSGLSAWRSALRASSDNWLTRFLMSCRMKAKRRLNSSNRWALRQRLLAMRFGQAARRLPAGGAQQVEIFPVERAAIIRAPPAGRGRSAGRRGSAGRRPRRVRRRQAMPGIGRCRSAIGVAQRREARRSSRIRGSRFELAPSARRRRASAREAGAGPVPVAACSISAPCSSRPAAGRRAHRRCRRRP